MFDQINSLEREDLVIVGKKYKILGHLSDFNSPYLSNNQLRMAVIKKMEEDNPDESGLKGGGKKKVEKEKLKNLL